MGSSSREGYHGVLGMFMLVPVDWPAASVPAWMHIHLLTE